ncbi:hypothetical protein LY78DRAFT_607253, partial [Colletotrichum sublineola]
CSCRYICFVCFCLPVCLCLLLIHLSASLDADSNAVTQFRSCLRGSDPHPVFHPGGRPTSLTFFSSEAAVSYPGRCSVRSGGCKHGRVTHSPHYSPQSRINSS